MSETDYALVTLKFERGTWRLIELRVQAESQAEIDELLGVLARGVQAEKVRRDP